MINEDSARILQLEYRGAPQTISVMRRAALSSQAHFSVRKLAESVCSGIDSKDYCSEYLAIYQMVLQRCRYMRDPRTVELVKAPYLVAEEILAGGRPSLDCDDMSALIAALVLSVGGATRLVTVAFRNAFYKGERQYSHVFAQAQDPRNGMWVVLDPVAADRTSKMLREVRASAVWPVP